MLSVFGLQKSSLFKAERAISSDCTETASAIIRREIPQSILKESTDIDASELKHYRFKNSIWNKIFSARDFEQFDEFEYFRLLEIYKDSNGAYKDLLAMNPVSIEQKLALIEAIQIKFSHFNNLPSIQDEVEALNVYKLKKLQSLIKKFDLSKKITRENLEEFSSEFYLILKGPPLSLLDYFTKNKTKRMNERLFRVLQEDMLLRGLKGTIQRIPEQANSSKIESTYLFVKKIMKYKIWRYMVVPYDLPWIDRIKVSDELLEKIFLDGLDAHKSELVLELKNQNAIDHYERFRKVYRPVAFGIGFYFYYQKYQKDQEAEQEKDNEEAKTKLMEELKKIANAINSDSTVVKTEDELREAQFLRVLQTFKDRYQEDPTPAEYKELREKIFGK